MLSPVPSAAATGGRRSPSALLCTALLWVPTPSLPRASLPFRVWMEQKVRLACVSPRAWHVPKGNFGPLLTVPACSAPACCQAAPPRAAAHQRCHRAPAVTLPSSNTKNPVLPGQRCSSEGSSGSLQSSRNTCDTGPAPSVGELLLLSAFSPLASVAVPTVQGGSFAAGSRGSQTLTKRKRRGDAPIYARLGSKPALLLLPERPSLVLLPLALLSVCFWPRFSSLPPCFGTSNPYSYISSPRVRFMWLTQTDDCIF